MKVNLTICVDTEIALAIKGRGINLSNLLNSFLKDYLTLPEPKGDNNQKKILEALQKLIKQRAEKAEEAKKTVRLVGGT